MKNGFVFRFDKTMNNIFEIFSTLSTVYIVNVWLDACSGGESKSGK